MSKQPIFLEIDERRRFADYCRRESAKHETMTY